MAKEKKLDEGKFNNLMKEVTSFGEMIRTHQDEKQSVMDDFAREKEMYHKGKISKKALDSSAKKVNKELSNLDKAIRKKIDAFSKVTSQAKKFAAQQHPHSFKASVSGISSGLSHKKKRPAKKAHRKHPVHRKHKTHRKKKAHRSHHKKRR